jgi:hypothetical protein
MSRLTRIVCLIVSTQLVWSFPLAAFHRTHQRPSTYLHSSRTDYEEEARELLAKAQAIRETLPFESPKQNISSELYNFGQTPWSLPAIATDDVSVTEYRLNIDIGREPGTWMDPLWGASEKRIELTLDVRFTDQPLKDEATLHALSFDNLAGKRGDTFTLESASYARLKKGFDRMKCHGGGYRVDQGKKNVDTVRFLILVNGVSGESYGDVSIPQGYLYFSIPVFGRRISQLSSKDGPVTVRQVGWHTGWRREESRIVGSFRAVPLDQARKRDGF